MATNDPVLVGLHTVPTSTSGAVLGYRLGGSGTQELVEFFAYDADALSYLDFYGRVSDRYAGGNFNVNFPWLAASATTGAVTWEVGFRRINTAEDIDASFTFSYQSVTTTTAATNGMPVYTTVAFTQAQADSIAAGEAVILRIKRVATGAGDTMAGNAQLLAWAVAAVEV